MMLAAITGLLTSLPKLLDIATNAWAYLQKISGNDLPGYLNQVSAAFSQLNAAKTQEEHANAAKAIAGLISNLPAK